MDDWGRRHGRGELEGDQRGVPAIVGGEGSQQVNIVVKGSF